MSNDTQAFPTPPPPFRRRLVLYPHQYITIPLLFLIPILALFNVFGEAKAVQQATSPALALRVEYEARSHYQAFDMIIATVTNQSDAPLDTVTVSFDRTYMDGFSQMTFTPTISAITDTAYEVELEDLQPGATQVITIDLRPVSFGAHSGTVRAAAEGLESVTVELNSFLFP